MRSRILVVDDEPQIRRVLRVSLTGAGYVVADARSGEEAVERLRTERFDMVLLDVNLPAGSYTAEINEGTSTLVPSTFLNLYAQSATLLYAVGQVKNNTVILETKTLRDVN